MIESKNIVLCGVGGQGTVLASKLIAAACMEKGIPVMSAETIGMAQRGGSVFSHLRMGGGLHSPMIKEKSADIILGFEPGETVRMLPYLKEGGLVVTAKRTVMPVTATLSGAQYSGDEMLSYLKEKVSNLIIVDTDEAMKELGSAKVMNILLLGAAISTGALGLDEEDIKAAITKRLKKQFHELNFRALSYVREHAE